MSRAHKAAIVELVKARYSSDDVISYFAQHHPKAFVDAVRATRKINWKDKCREMAKNKQTYISAIKLYREKTGCGLKESKDAVDMMRDSA
jgi:ribosomal protein L7/L12